MENKEYILKNVQVGDIVLFRITLHWYNFLAKLIRWITKSQYSHAAIVTEIDGTLYLNESTQIGVHTTPLVARLEKSKFEVDLFRLSDIGFDKLVALTKTKQNFPDLAAKRANSKLGLVRYDFWNLLIYEPIFRIFHVYFGAKNIEDSDKMICSQYVAWCYLELFKDNWFEISPSDLSINENFIKV